MQTSRTNSRQGAFTLIEVLVVVAIIALLVAILVPSLARARTMARTTQCRSQVRQVVVAIGEYTVEWSKFPRGSSPNEVHWTRLIARMFGDKINYTNINQLNVEKFEAFHCPERTPKLPFPFVDYVANALQAVTKSMYGGPAWCESKYGRLSKFKRPAGVAYILDAELEDLNKAGGSSVTLREARENWKSGIWKTDPTANAIDGMDVWIGDQLPQNKYNKTDAIGTRRVARKMHLNRWTNIGFLDGHADGVQLETKDPDGAADQTANYSVWLRRFGVKDELVPTMSAATLVNKAVNTPEDQNGREIEDP